MMSSLAQTALFAPGPEITAVRTLLGELLEQPENTAYIARLMSGSDTRYETGDPHPLAGRMVPDLTLETADGTQRVAELLRKARPVLLTLTATPAITDAAAGWRDRVDIIPATSTNAPATALLIRPDGYVAWASSEVDHPDTNRLHTALTRWFGTPLT